MNGHPHPRHRPGRRVALAAVSLALAFTAEARADVILSSEALNTALKKMQRLQQQIESDGPRARAEALFQLGVEADALAVLLNDEVTAHGMQEKLLIDLALDRTREMGITITYNREKEKFFYQGAAFQQYLKEAPRGPRAAEASFWLVESAFYQSSPTDPASLLRGSEQKKTFLRRYPMFALTADVGVFLAIDYRDLYRHYLAAGDAAKRDRFRELARSQFRHVVERFPGSEQARIAEEMLRRFEAELGGRQR